MVREKRGRKRNMPEKLKIRSGILQKGSDEHDTAGMTVAELAEIHEFGLGVPRRSFVRAWFDAKQASILDLMRRQFTRGDDPAIAAERVALALEADQKNWINEKTNLQKNADSTVARKGSDVPLVDTGILRSAITSEVVK